jgi:hypothetical protein
MAIETFADASAKSMAAAADCFPNSACVTRSTTPCMS